MNRIGVVIVEHKSVVVAATGDGMELPCLIPI